MMRGLPGAGKSTVARKIVEQGNYTRVNRDLLREMLHFGEWSKQNESIVVDIEKTIVRHLLLSGENVVVDDCNLGESHAVMWKEVAMACESHLLVQTMEVSINECIERDSKREGKAKVGKAVIMRMVKDHNLSSDEEMVGDIDEDTRNWEL